MATDDTTRLIALRLARAVLARPQPLTAHEADLLARGLIEAEAERQRGEMADSLVCDHLAELEGQVATLTAERDEARAALTLDTAWRSNWEEQIGAQRDEAWREVEQMRKQCDAAIREADRLRHGVPIEGDFVCPDSLALVETRREIERWRPVIEAARAWRANDVGGDHGRDLFIPSVKSSDVLRDALDILATKERGDG